MDKVKQISPKLYNDFLAKTDILAQRYIAVQKNGYNLVDQSMLMNSESFNERVYKEDYTRYCTFELMANEILNRGVEGAVAELGVFKGVFSRLINCKFKTKKMYLFDTFDSFSNEEFQEEVAAGRCTEDFINVFKETSVDEVLDRMLYPENIKIRKGFFPDSLEGMKEERYCFVSIDVDLEKSILEGLRYFYPRLNAGGAIFVHDYNNRFLEGVRQAVKKYEEETGQNLIKVPLSDEGGTLVICK